MIILFQIRKQAIRELPSFCRQCTEYTRRVADILSQLLQAAEATELIVVRSSLISLFNIDPKGLCHLLLSLECRKDLYLFIFIL